MNFAGKNHATTVDLTAIMLGAGVCLSLIMQIGEQIDYLRFMPPKTAENSKSWWLAVFSAGPGWVVLGAIKQIIGAFLGRLDAHHQTLSGANYFRHRQPDDCSRPDGGRHV